MNEEMNRSYLGGDSAGVTGAGALSSESNETQLLWERAKKFYLMSLNTDIERNQADRYLSMVAMVTMNGSLFTIVTGNSFAAEMLQTEYASKLKGSFILAGAPDDIAIEVKCDESLKPKSVISAPTIVSTSSMGVTNGDRQKMYRSPIALDEEYTFESFVSGPSNSFAIAAAKAVVSKPGRPGYNPLFIHGGTGLGKTHLMQAIGNEIKRNNPSASICYVTAEVYVNDYVNNLSNLQKFKEKYRNIDVLLIDDIQFLKKAGATQEEFFNNFNALKDKKKQIDITSDVAPKNLPSTIEERLISRFEGGMLQEIEMPNYETRLAILRKKVENSETRIPDYCLEFIADNIKSHVRAMEGALATVEVFINANPRIEMNTSILTNILDDFIKKEVSIRKLTIEEIQQACAKKYGVSMADILSHERTQSIVTPRQMAMFISKKCTSKGLQEIGDAFKKSHATIISGVRTITQRLCNEEDLKVELEEILNSFGYKLSDVIELS